MKSIPIQVVFVVLFMSSVEFKFSDAVCGTCATGNGECVDDTCWCATDKGGPDCASDCSTCNTQVCTGTDTSPTCIDCPTGAAACVNGACASKAGDATAYCRCTAGWEGATCATDIDDCSPNPCLNGGVCTDKVNGYTCACADGYTGTDCDKVNCATGDPCLNGGTCNATPDPDVCTCAAGYTGLICHQVDCNGDPCVEGTCNATPDPDECTCDSGYAGLICDKVKCDDADNQCENEGTCGTDGLCDCADGFTGDLCAEGGASRITTGLPLMLIALFIFKLFN